jgi:protein TonB
MKNKVFLYIKIFGAVIILLQASPSNGLNPKAAKNTKLIVELSTVPEFPGGLLELQKFLKKNIIYPQMERDNNVSGIVTIMFLVDETGKVGNAEVIQRIISAPKSHSLDKEALRMVSLLPNWKPAYYGKKPVAVYYTIDIVFEIKKETDKGK